jgi:hypothetical protein
MDSLVWDHEAVELSMESRQTKQFGITPYHTVTQITPQQTCILEVCCATKRPIPQRQAINQQRCSPLRL